MSNLVAHKIALRPNRKQETYFRKAAGVARFVYNWGLAEWEKQVAARKENPELPAPSWMALSKQFNAVKEAQFPWCYEVSSKVVTRALSDLGEAWQNYFRDLKAGRFKTRDKGRPSFKSKRDKASFYLHNATFTLSESHLRISKIGKPHDRVRICEPLRFHGKIMGGAISEEGGKWFLSVQVDAPDQAFLAPAPEETKVGVDLGLTHVAVLSTGEKIDNPRHLKASERRLKIRQRRLSRKEEAHKVREKVAGKKLKRGTSWRRAQLAVNRVHGRVRNQRAAMQHNLTHQIARDFAVVGVETLRVQNMQKNRHLAKAISGVGMHEIKRQLEYKVAKRGGKVIAANTWFASSKTCSSCGHKVEKMSLNVREWDCPACGAHHDRDVNAAINLREYAVIELSKPPKEVEAKPKRTRIKRKSLKDAQELSTAVTARTSQEASQLAAEISTAVPAESNATLVECISPAPLVGGIGQCSEVEASAAPNPINGLGVGQSRRKTQIGKRKSEATVTFDSG